MNKCPCCSGIDFTECCKPYLEGTQKPRTATALLRSRYTAFTKQDIKYVRQTTHRKNIEQFDEAAARSWSESSHWMGLEILNSSGGRGDDEEGTIEFAATYIQDEEEKVHHEISRFERDRGRWFFVEGKYAGGQTYTRETPKVGRNEPCPCGSGRKYKKCCGK